MTVFALCYLIALLVSLRRRSTLVHSSVRIFRLESCKWALLLGGRVVAIDFRISLSLFVQYGEAFGILYLMFSI